MISWIVIMLLLTLPNAIPTRSRGQNIIWYFDPPSRYFDSPQIIDDKVLFLFHIYLIRSIIILKYINDFLSSSNAFNLTLQQKYPNSTRGQNIVRYFDSPQIINDKVLFAVHICLIRSINILTSLITSWVVLMLLISTLLKTIPTWPGGQNIVRYFDPHPPSNNQWQSFSCLSYLLEKMYYYIKIVLMISWVSVMLSFCTTNTLVINGFISCKLKQDTSHHLILFR